VYSLNPGGGSIVNVPNEIGLTRYERLIAMLLTQVDVGLSAAAS
jgi:hypothetical protein